MQQIGLHFDSLSGQEATEVQAFLSEMIQFVADESQRQQELNVPQEAPEPIAQELVGPPPTSSAQLLWILAGQKVDAFIHYLENYPDPQAHALLQNPEELDRVINYLNRIMPAGQQPVVEGIPHADINSSNIYGFRYDPQSGSLRVRFQNGSVYGYQGVPPQIFNLFKQGAIAAKTNGQNNFGRWWIGKQPSLGASFYELIRSGGYPYQKLK